MSMSMQHRVGSWSPTRGPNRSARRPAPRSPGKPGTARSAGRHGSGSEADGGVPLLVQRRVAVRRRRAAAAGRGRGEEGVDELVEDDGAVFVEVEPPEQRPRLARRDVHPQVLGDVVECVVAYGAVVRGEEPEALGQLAAAARHARAHLLADLLGQQVEPALAADRLQDAVAVRHHLHVHRPCFVLVFGGSLDAPLADLRRLLIAFPVRRAPHVRPGKVEIISVVDARLGLVRSSGFDEDLCISVGL
mmetsp:Transcript_9472/g.20321  ORF Transcript_9472/g.20321 Transcript_9472/m.20321 type:complete len:247 (-) Transcript_9472:369-1109(-)